MANAVLGLYYAGVADVERILEILLEAANPGLSTSLAWAMGRMPEAGVEDLLRRLTTSGNPGVRLNAEMSLEVLVHAQAKKTVTGDTPPREEAHSVSNETTAEQASAPCRVPTFTLIE